MCSAELKGRSNLEAVLEFLADEIQDDGIDTGVHGGQVDAKVV